MNKTHKLRREWRKDRGKDKAREAQMDEQQLNKKKGGIKMNKPIGKRVTSVAPLIGALSALEMMKDQALGKDVSGRDTAMTDKIGDITIDTCVPSDTGVWETGIKRDSVERKWVIVSQYESDEEAERGHKQWVKLMEEKPKCKLKDVNMWNL